MLFPSYRNQTTISLEIIFLNLSINKLYFVRTIYLGIASLQFIWRPNYYIFIVLIQNFPLQIVCYMNFLFRFFPFEVIWESNRCFFLVYYF